MSDKKIVKWLLILGVMVLVNGCVTTRSSKDSLSDKEKAEMNLQMGVRYMEMNMLRVAKEKLDVALQLNDSSAETNNALAVLHERLNQLGLAKSYYQTAIKLSPDDASIKNNYGRFLCDRGSIEEGLLLLKEAVNTPLNNRRWFAYTNIGRCELRKGNAVLAEGYFRQALQENADYPPALSEMQKISYRDGKFMSARAFLERYLAESKHNAETLWYAVQTERALGNKSLADEYREQLFKLFPASKEAQQLKTAIK